jgi:rare lipoprotein A
MLNSIMAGLLLTAFQPYVQGSMQSVTTNYAKSISAEKSNTITVPAALTQTNSEAGTILSTAVTRSDSSSALTSDLRVPSMRESLDDQLLEQPVAATANECGTATWYGSESGSVTASGEAFTGHDLTAAHPYLPMNSYILVVDQYSGASVSVRVNDRGPFSGAILDLSEAAFSQIASLDQGITSVCIYAQ